MSPVVVAFAAGLVTGTFGAMAVYLAAIRRR